MSDFFHSNQTPNFSVSAVHSCNNVEAILVTYIRGVIYLSLCIGLVIRSEWIHFQSIRAPSLCVIVDTLQFDPRSIQYQKRSMKPTKITREQLEMMKIFCNSITSATNLFPLDSWSSLITLEKYVRFKSKNQNESKPVKYFYPSNS